MILYYYLLTSEVTRWVLVSYVSLLQSLINFNRAALEHLQARIEERDEVKLFSDATQQFSEKKKKQKNRAILTLAS